MNIKAKNPPHRGGFRYSKVSKSAAIGKMLFHSVHSRIGSSVTLAGDHTTSEHDLYRSFWHLPKIRFQIGSSFFPQKQSFCGSPISHPISKSAAIGKMFFHSVHSRIGSRLSLDSGDHIGSPLRMSASKCGFPRAPATSEHALFSSLFLKEKHRFFGGSSFIPQKQSFCGSPISHPISKSAALGKMFFLSAYPRIGSRLSLARRRQRWYRWAHIRQDN